MRIHFSESHSLANSLEGKMRFFFPGVYSLPVGHERRGERVREWKLEKVKHQSVSTLCICMYRLYVRRRKKGAARFRAVPVLWRNEKKLSLESTLTVCAG